MTKRPTDKRKTEKPVRSSSSSSKKSQYTDLMLSAAELVHLRDLFGIKIPPEMTTTLSECLAAQQQREMIETMLWQKIVAACERLGVAVGDTAPDFTILPTAPSPLAVFEVEQETGDDEE